MVSPAPKHRRRLCIATAVAILALIALPFLIIAQLNNRSR